MKISLTCWIKNSAKILPWPCTYHQYEYMDYCSPLHNSWAQYLVKLSYCCYKMQNSISCSYYLFWIDIIKIIWLYKNVMIWNIKYTFFIIEKDFVHINVYVFKNQPILLFNIFYIAKIICWWSKLVCTYKITQISIIQQKKWPWICKCCQSLFLG